MKINGSVALITGAASGFGRAFTDALLKKGASVFMVDAQLPLLSSVYDQFKSSFGLEKVKFACADVRFFQSVEDVFKQCVKEFGCVNIVCNNAGILNEEKPDLMIDVNLKGVVYGSNLGVKYMSKENGGAGGVIINSSSAAGLFSSSSLPVYSATKHGVVGLTGAMGCKKHFQHTGIRVNCLCPAYTDTPMLERAVTEQWIDEDAKRSLANTPLIPVDTVVSQMLRLVENDELNGVAVGILSSGIKDTLVAARL